MPSVTAIKLLSVKTDVVQELGEHLVYLLLGNDDYILGLVLQQIKNARLNLDFADFNYVRIECAANTKEVTVVDALNELPMLCQHRLLELNNAQLLTAEVSNAVAESLSQVQAYQQMITCIVWKGNAKGKAGAVALRDTANRLGLVIDCSVTEQARALWIEQELLRRSITPTPSIVNAIAQRTGNDLQNLAGQLKKLAAFLGPNKEPTLADIKRLVNKSSETKAWEFTAAIGKQDVRAAIDAANDLLADGQANGVAGLLSYTNSYIRSLVQLAFLERQYGSDPSALAPFLPGKKPYSIKKSLQELMTWSALDQVRALNALLRADLRIKTGGDPILVLQLLVLQLCRRKGNPKSSASKHYSR